MRSRTPIRVPCGRIALRCGDLVRRTAQSRPSAHLNVGGLVHDGARHARPAEEPAQPDVAGVAAQLRVPAEGHS